MSPRSRAVLSGDSGSVADLPRQVERIVQSEAFRGSETLRRLLEYLTSRALENSCPNIKAKDIAASVFGRMHDFDPQNDSIVRVHAGRLRAKLAEYYFSEGSEDNLVITIPKGSYGIMYHHRGKTGGETIDEAIKERIDLAPAQAPAPPIPRRPGTTFWYILGLLAAVAGTWVAASLTRAPGRVHLTPGLATFWHGFLTNDDQVLLVYSNMRVRSAHSERQVLLPTNGEVFGVFQMTKFFTALQKPVYPKHGNLLAWDEAKDVNLVFLGGPLAETPLRTVPTLREFAFTRNRDSGDAATEGIGRIDNLHPQKGEPAFYLGSPSPKRFDYAVVAMNTAFNPKRRAVTIAGIAGYGTQGAAEFVTREDRVEEVLSRLAVRHGAPMPSFEAVIRFNIQGEVAIQPQIITIHRLN